MRQRRAEAGCRSIPTGSAERKAWRQIAVVVDDSETSRVALQTAVAAARRHHARLTIICVARRAWPIVALIGICPQRLEAEATEHAAATVRRLAATVPADMPCTTMVRCGHATKEILGILRECHTDVVFLVLRSGGGLGRPRDRRKAMRLMRAARVDLVLSSFSSSTLARASVNPLVGEEGSESGPPELGGWLTLPSAD